MELSSVLSKVRGLVAKAEHPNTDPTEAQAYRAKADALMLQYAIDQAQLRQAAPAAERPKPGILTITIPDADYLTGYVAWLVDSVAEHTRCMVRSYTKYTKEGWECNVYGFEADLKFFELMYTTLSLHMLGTLLPRLDQAASLEDNVYRLHNAGYNWLEIAEMYGWRQISFYEAFNAGHGQTKVPYKHRETGEIQPATQVGSRIKRAYHRAVQARGEQPTIISANGSETYRRSAAQGYISRLSQRMRQVERGRSTGSELVLAGSANDLMAYFREHNPDMFEEVEPQEECEACKRAKSGHCRKHPKGRSYAPRPTDYRAYQAGVEHANSADLNATPRTGAPAARQLSS